jgi:hypothetical protein
MAEFVRFTLDDGSKVLFESAESDLVALHGGQPDVLDGGRLTASGARRGWARDSRGLTWAGRR